MALKCLPTVRSTLKVACSFDPDVDAPEGLKGWVDISRDGVTAARGADILELRPLSNEERATVRDAGGMNAASFKRCLLGVKSINGKEGAFRVRKWLDGLADDTLILLLGEYIRCITDAIDPERVQAIWCGSSDSQSEEGGEDDAGGE